MNLKNVRLPERSQIQKAVYCVTTFIHNVENRQSSRHIKQISGY